MLPARTHTRLSQTVAHESVPPQRQSARAQPSERAEQAEREQTEHTEHTDYTEHTAEQTAECKFMPIVKICLCKTSKSCWLNYEHYSK